MLYRIHEYEDLEVSSHSLFIWNLFCKLKLKYILIQKKLNFPPKNTFQSEINVTI